MDIKVILLVRMAIDNFTVSCDLQILNNQQIVRELRICLNGNKLQLVQGKEQHLHFAGQP